MMQKIRPDMDIGKNIQSIRYANKLIRSGHCKIEPDGNFYVQKHLCQAGNQPHEHQDIGTCCLAKIFHTDINAFFSALL